jgi:hypothetical protein
MLIDSRLLELFALESPEGMEAPHVATQWAVSSLSFLAGIHQGKSEALKTIVNEHGWPQDEQYTDHAEAAAFMIVLHADYDLEFQIKCHSLMLELATRGRIARGYIAFLTDRILCNKGLHQRFGTQIREATNGYFVPKALEHDDEAEVDAQRKEAGLDETMLEYYQRINSGDMLLPRTLIGEYADIWEHKTESSNVIDFPGKPI